MGRRDMKPIERVRALLAEGRLVRMRELQGAGVTRMAVRRLVEAGELVQAGHGVYRAAEAPLDDKQGLAEAVIRVPDGVVCLHTAANVQGLSVNPIYEVFLAVPAAKRPPNVQGVRIVQWSRTEMFEVGIETRRICGVDVRITDPSRTVADLFRALSTRMPVTEEDALDAYKRYLDRGFLPERIAAAARDTGTSNRLLSSMLMSAQSGLGLDADRRTTKP